jgi:5-methylcytosine-specific restriction protein A
VVATINLESGNKWWARRPKPKVQEAWTDNDDFYNSTAWRNCRKSYMDNNPLCEVSRYEKKYHAGKDCDHIIPVRFGGAKFDPRNLMSMTQFYHRRKTGFEKNRNAPLVEYVTTENGLIPRRREDLMMILIRNFIHD